MGEGRLDVARLVAACLAAVTSIETPKLERLRTLLGRSASSAVKQTQAWSFVEEELVADHAMLGAARR